MRIGQLKYFFELFIFAAFAAIGLSCSDKAGPAGPAPGETVPVKFAAELEGRWRTDNLFALGLPVSELLVPGLTPGRYDARLDSYDNDLVVSVTGEQTGIFSLISTGVAADTADPLQTVGGAHEVTGSFRLNDGQLEVILLLKNSAPVNPPQAFSGGARLLADTLLLDFTLEVTPHKAVLFLPAEASFLARLVKR